MRTLPAPPPSTFDRWLDHFQQNRRCRPEPDWDRPCAVPAKTAACFARSLAGFQLGEDGDGSVLLVKAGRAYGHEPAFVEALALFVAEEQEHARLLAGLVHHLGGQLIDHHWAQGIFRVLRQRLGVEFELEVLLIAEMIGTAYYRLLRQGGRDLVLRQVCDLLLGDEAHHLAFHRDRLGAWQAGWGQRRRWLWQAQFRALLAISARAAWLDHGRALRAAGADRATFLRLLRSLSLTVCGPPAAQTGQ